MATKYAPRGGLDRQELEELVARGLTLREIAAEVGRSVSTVRYWIDRFMIETRLSKRRKLVDEALTRGEVELDFECATHGVTKFVVENGGRTRCKACRSEAVTKRRRKVKQILVAEAGGRCVHCGYSAHQAALEFHHVDPTRKNFHLSFGGRSMAIDTLRSEAAKCVLLCANCHAAVEAGAIALELGVDTAKEM